MISLFAVASCFGIMDVASAGFTEQVGAGKEANDQDLEMKTVQLYGSIEGHKCIDGWAMTMPSMLYDDDDVKVAVRASCVTRSDKSRSGAVWHGKIIIGEVEKEQVRSRTGEWNFTHLQVVDDPLFRSSAEVLRECDLGSKAGLPEDPTIFSLNGKTYISEASYDTVEKHSQKRPACSESGVKPQHMLREVLNMRPKVDLGKPVKLFSEFGSSIKNHWGLFKYGGSQEQLMAVVSVAPHRVMSIDVQSGLVRDAYETPTLVAEKLAAKMGVAVDVFQGGAGMAPHIASGSREYFLGVMHMSGNENSRKPFRSWPYRFSTQPPFNVIDVGLPLPVVDDLTADNSTQKSFVSSVHYDPAHGGEISISYNYGDEMSRVIRMGLGEFEEKYFKPHAQESFFLRRSIVQDPFDETILEMMNGDFAGRLNRCYNDNLVPEVIVGGAPHSGVHELLRDLKRSDSLVISQQPLDKFLKSSFSRVETGVEYCRDEVISDTFAIGLTVNDCTEECEREHSCMYAAFWKNSDVSRCRLTSTCQLGAKADQMKLLQKQAGTVSVPDHRIDNSTTVALQAEVFTRFPECTYDKRMVVAEYTSKLFTVDGGPHYISELFRNTNGLRGMLRFMVVLRDPLTRFLKHYAVERHSGFCKGHLSTDVNTMVMRLVRKGNVCNCVCDDLVMHANYVAALRSNFEWFRSNQFRIIPSTLIDGAYFSELTFQFLRLEASVEASPEDVGPNLDENSLLAELLPDARSELVDFLDGISGPRLVAQILASSDAELHGFFRGWRSVDNIAAWLSDYW